MLKNLLLNYIMGKYRKNLVIFSCLMCTLSTIRYYYVIDTQLYSPEIIFFLLTPVPFVLALHNVPTVGMPSVDKNSSDLDIYIRFYGLVGMFVLLLGYVFLTFNPELMNS
jgi:hypothetical protein